MKLKQAQVMVRNIRSFIFRSYRTSTDIRTRRTVASLIDVSQSQDTFSGPPWSILNLLSHRRV